ncbi:winged helix-turn-helix domain-containing protein [Pimelobacter simplex]|nr:winged helix-turn-helix domain-containing protein [Pimelobacter simplex]
MLQEMRGRGVVDEILAEVERRMSPLLTDGDYDLVDNHELRWRNAARWERKDMVRDGLITPTQERGVWELTPRGRSTPPEGGRG